MGKAFAEKGWEVTSLDLDPKTEATIKENILTWNFNEYPVGFFDAVWASPCCTQYSCARTKANKPRDLEGADALVKKTLEIIDYFQPRCWFIENPETGLLKTRGFMEGIPFTDADYCCYCDWGYKKRTRIWTNTGLLGNKCRGPGECPNMDGKKHRNSAQQGLRKTKEGMHGERNSTKKLDRIPPGLCAEIEKNAFLQDA